MCSSGTGIVSSGTGTSDQHRTHVQLRNRTHSSGIEKGRLGTPGLVKEKLRNMNRLRNTRSHTVVGQGTGTHISGTPGLRIVEVQFRNRTYWKILKV
jgi:hypothetical protein